MANIKLPIIVTPSRVELGLRCYRRHVLSDILLRARQYSPSLEFGSVIHAGAAAHWLGKSGSQAALDEWNKRFEANPNLYRGDLSSEMVEAMMATYSKLALMQGPFSLEPGDWQFVTVEDRLEVPLGAYKLSFQTDRVVYNKDTQHLVIIDTKTAGRLDARWARQWEMSLQMKLYKAAAVRAYDFPIENVDVVVEGVLKDVPSKIQYIPCPEWSREVLDEALEQASYIAARDYETLTKDGFLLPVSEIEEIAVNKTSLNYMSCFEYGVECPFRKLCVAEPAERVAILRSEYFEVESEY